MAPSRIAIGSRTLSLLTLACVLLLPCTGWAAAESASFRLTTDAQDQATRGPLQSANFRADINAETWRNLPLASQSFNIVTVPISVSSSSVRSSSSSTSSSFSSSSSEHGNRRPRPPIEPPATSDSSSSAPRHPAARPFPGLSSSAGSASSTASLSSGAVLEGKGGSGVVRRGSGAVTTGKNLMQFFDVAGIFCPPLEAGVASSAPSSIFLWLIIVVATMLYLELRRRKLRAKKYRHVYLCVVAIILLAIAALLSGTILTAHAAGTTPQRHAYNGHLLDAGGQPITTPHTIRFSYWTSADAVSGDTTATGAIAAGAATYAGWQELHTVTPDSNGFFSVELGDTTPLPDFASLPASTLLSMYLQVEVKAQANPDTAYELLDVDAGDTAVDRSGVLSVPFAINADMVDQREIGTGSGDIAILGSGGTLSQAAIPGGTAQDGFTIDSDNTATDEIILTFGDTLAKTLSYDISSSAFRFNDDVEIQGNLTVSGLVNGVNLTALQSSTGALKASSGGGLTLNVSAGSFRLNGIVTNYSGGTITLPPSATSVVFFGSGGLMSSLLGFPQDETAIPVAEVLTSPGAILSLTDRRILQSDDRARSAVVTFTPSYEKASYQGDGADNVGQLSVSTDNIALKNFYLWTSTRSTLQDYDIILKVPLPDDFTAWTADATTNPMTLGYRTTSAAAADAKLDLQVYDTNGIPVTLSGATTGLSSLSWAETPIEFTGSPTWTPGQEMLVRFKVSAKDTYQIHVGSLKLSYSEFSPGQ